MDDNKKYLAAARRLYGCDGQIEFDDDAKVSVGEDPGAYVQAWIWVNAVEAGVVVDEAVEDE